MEEICALRQANMNYTIKWLACLLNSIVIVLHVWTLRWVPRLALLVLMACFEFIDHAI
jgi:hypothetical protein